MKRKNLLALTLAALLLLSGCGGGSDAPKNTAASDKAEMWVESPGAPAPMPESEPMEMPDMSFAAVAGGSGGSVYQRSDAKLIRRCSMEMQTTEFDAAIQALYDLVEAKGGYFENSSLRGGGYYNANARRTGDYVIRIPADQYSAFRTGVGELAYITYSNESTEDIGEQYYDTEARLKTLRTKQERLLSLLEKADTMEDIIKLESALGDVEYQIESYSSTLNRYDGLVSFATFNLTVSEVVRVDETTGEADSLADRMGAGFRSGLRNLKDDGEDLLVWLAYNLVGVIVFVAAAGVVVVFIRRKKLRMPRFPGRKNRSDDET